MKLIDTISYSKIKVLFVSSHYDLHLEGLCRFNNKICLFKTLVGDYNEEKDDFDEFFCEIYELTFKEKIKKLFFKKKFELMVGYHWSYPQRKKGVRFYYRKPVWFYKILYNLFYKK
ncbi:MAG: hypothetical protein ABIP51_18150 [Bacteroidia bacterium]